MARATAKRYTVADSLRSLAKYKGVPRDVANDLLIVAHNLDVYALEIRNQAFIKDATSAPAYPDDKQAMRDYSKATGKLLEVSDAIGDNRDADEK